MRNIEDFHRPSSFKVPENYFEEFAQKFAAEQLPRQKTTARILPLKRWAAAASVAIVIGLSAYLWASTRPEATTAQVTTIEQSSDMIDDYVMMDNEAIYAYVSNY